LRSVGIFCLFCLLALLGSGLAVTYSVPDEYHMALFDDFKEAAEAKDLRRLLNTISDWMATAELYADKHLAQEVQQAIEKRREGADWLHG